MIPIDHEFVAVYILYGLLLIYLLVGYFTSKRKRFFGGHLILMAVYSAFLGFTFYGDSDNFNGGNSLAVLVYSLFLVLIHWAILGVIKAWRWFSN